MNQNTLTIMSTNFRKLVDSLNLTDQASSTISRYLERTVSGSEEILISPIGKNTDPDKILSDWDDIFRSKQSDLDVDLLKLEESNRSKYGPRSIAVPWVDRRDGVYEYYSANKNKSVDNIPDLGNRLRPLSIPNAAEYLKNNTNSGLPFVMKKGKVKSKVVNDLDSLLKRKDPCVLFTRTQEGKKTRTVWGYPIADTLNEMTFYRPILEYQSRLDWRSSIVSPEAVDNGVLRLMKHSLENDLHLVSIDFSAYDSSIKRSLIESAFKYFRSLFQRQFHDNLNYIMERMITIGLITPDGVLTGDHGVPSGSTFTNEVDSVVQYLISNEFYEELLFQQIQGDDGLYATANPEQLLDHFRSYGLNVNDEKSYTSKSYCLFLQKYYSYRYINEGIVGGIYPVYRALNRLVYPERFVEFKGDISGEDYFAIRNLSILENCKYHPLFSDLVKYVVKLDKYPLPSDKGISDYVKFRNKEDSRDVNFQVHSYGNSTSIKDFESYKLVRKLI